MLKDWLISLLLAFGIWLIHMCSLSYTDIVTVPVIAQSNLEGCSAFSTNQGDIAARCEMTGFQLIKASRSGRRPIYVSFNASDFRKVGDGEYSISASALGSYVKEIFGEGASVSSFVVSEVRFRFAEETYVKVPVQAAQFIEYKPQYMAVGEIRLQPDSVIVYGEPNVLENIDRVVTVPLEKNKVNASIHGILKLEKPVGNVRLSETQVNYSLDVSRYVEVKSNVRIQTANVPAGKHLTIFPSTADVVFRCVFPMNSDPTEKVVFSVDYKEFAKSLSGRLVAHPSNLSKDIIDYSIDPPYFECVEGY